MSTLLRHGLILSLCGTPSRLREGDFSFSGPFSIGAGMIVRGWLGFFEIFWVTTANGRSGASFPFPGNGAPDVCAILRHELGFVL